ncbi:MAG: kinase-like domain-containing protein [Monoraphidium minutum]|nr:MAG: kinase-like domain-containing protein [Monoraphidium minutum]
MGEVLGTGTYGTVRICTHRGTGEQFAAKILQRRRNKVDRTAAIEKEACMADRVSWCPSVARTHAVHSDAYSVYLVQELLVGGSLQALLDTQGQLSEEEAAAALRGVLEAIAACHDEGICYGDVKPANFMLASLYPSVSHLADPSAPKGAVDVRMVDLGCAQECPDECSLSGLSGTPVYMAPEVAAGEPYGPASDLWGVGVMLYQLLTGAFPFGWRLEALAAMPVRRVLEDVATGAVSLDEGALPPGAAPLLRALLERDPEKRVSARGALAHPWLAAQ